MKTKLLITYRIIKHLIMFFNTGLQIHLLEVEHYYLMKKFKL